MDISDFPTRHNYGLALWQSDFERILADWVDELGVPILREREVTGFAQDDAGVDVELSDGAIAAGGLPRRLRRRPQRGPQGGRHRVRRVGPDDQLDDRRGRDGRGARASACAPRVAASVPSTAKGGGPYGVVLTERRPVHDGEPTLEDLRENARRPVRHGLRGARRPTWISRFTDMTRQAASYREGRVLLAGDAAHVHAPTGRPGPQHRRAGRGEPRLEAGPGGRRDLTGHAPGHLPRRTSPGRRPGPAQHDGPGRAQRRPTSAPRR